MRDVRMEKKFEKCLSLSTTRMRKVNGKEFQTKRWWSMFIRFVSGEVDGDSHVSAGLFCAAEKLLEEVVLSEYEYEALMEPVYWFRRYLIDPFDYRLEPAWLASQSICWFRSTAHEHLRHAWEMVAILEEHGTFMRMIKCEVPGYIIYEDEAQVLAYPVADVRRRL